MREFSNQFLSEIFAENTSATPLYLLRYEVRDNSGNLEQGYYVNNYEDITSNGITYEKSAFTISLGKDATETVPQVRLSFDSGDRQLINKLREYDDTPKFYISVVVAQRPDEVEIGEIEYELNDWSVESTAITMNLKVEPVLDEPIPADIITPRIAPGLWGTVNVQEI